MIHIDFTLSYLELYLFLINLLSFTIYTYDKIQSFQNKSRISEKTLLFFLFFGGVIGAIISMLTFRHKIKKPSFMIKFLLILIIELIILILYLKGFELGRL